MKTIYLFTIILLVVFSACNDEESCTENGLANEECLDVAIEYDVFDITTGRELITTTEYMLVTYQFGPGSPRFSFTLWATQYNNQVFDTEGETFQFDTSKDFNAATMTFNGDFNTTGLLTANFTKIDRENGLVSGTITWDQDENDFVDSDSFSGTFKDVSVDF